jgi:hypothetical protein
MEFQPINILIFLANFQLGFLNNIHIKVKLWSRLLILSNYTQNIKTKKEFRQNPLLIRTRCYALRSKMTLLIGNT